MSEFFGKVVSFFTPSKVLNTSVQPATSNKAKPVNTTANPLSPLAKQLNFNKVQTGGKRKSLKRKNKKNNKTKRR